MSRSTNAISEFRFTLGEHELVPIVIGAMGFDVSTPAMALEGARLGGISHISDSNVFLNTDKHYGTKYVKMQYAKYGHLRNQPDKTTITFDPADLYAAEKLHAAKVMERKVGPGLIFVNCLEKTALNQSTNQKRFLGARLNGLLDGGIDGITLAAGLNLQSFHVLNDNPRFRTAKLGIIVSSVRALKIFLKKNEELKRLPDYVIVEGPLAGGHLGFKIDEWQSASLERIFLEVLDFIKLEGLNIPVIPAGGIFTGTDGATFIEAGAAAVQVATRFTITKESGFPAAVKQAYFESQEEDVEVNMTSPVGYPMRMLKQSPSLTSSNHPNCEAFGYVLYDGKCKYIDAYNAAKEKAAGEKFVVSDTFCVCTQAYAYKMWTCGHNVYRLKDTSVKRAGKYLELTTEHVFNDYLNSKHDDINLP
jgi:nitronate monooxygenase